MLCDAIFIHCVVVLQLGKFTGLKTALILGGDRCVAYNKRFLYAVHLMFKLNEEYKSLCSSPEWMISLQLFMKTLTCEYR